jgi:phage shock protein C
MAETEKVLRSNKDFVIAGVCGGLAEYFKIDPIIIRIIFIVLSFGGGSGILIYVILWLVLPMQSGIKKENLSNFRTNIKNNMTSKSFVGLIILLVGVVALLNQIIPIKWDIFWPIILILVGLFFIFRKK